MSERKPEVSITYCTQCNWLLRSGWMAQELLSTFSLELAGVTLVPGTGGIFEIRIDGDLVWERKRDGGFPDVKALKQLVRDRVDPDRDLGHIDRQAPRSAGQDPTPQHRPWPQELGNDPCGVPLLAPKGGWPLSSRGHSMKKMLLAGIAALALAAAAPAYAQNNDTKAAAGATAGGATGAVIGGLIGGPIGAIIGGFSGAAIGADAAVPDEVVAYAGNNPVDVVSVQGVEVGAPVTGSITVHPTDNPDYGYFYANNRIYIVDMKGNKIVSSPGYLVPQSTVSYVEANPSTAVTFSGDLSAGVALPADVQLTPIPDNPYYSYVYIGDRPVLVDNSTRTVIWTR